MRLAEIAIALGARLENGSPDLEITGVAGIREAGPGHLTFVANPKYAGDARTTKASAVIVVDEFPTISAALLRSKNPYLAFARAIELFCQPPRYEPGVHPTAVLHPVGPGRRGRAHRTLRGDRPGRRNWTECGVAGPRGHLPRRKDRRQFLCARARRGARRLPSGQSTCSCRMAWLLEPMASASPRTTPDTGTRSCSLSRS